MDNQEKSKADAIARKYEAIVNWPLLRKFESLVFAGLFLALPLFAWKVVEHSTTQLAVKNSAVDLVNDLIRCKSLAKQHQVSITLTSRPPTAVMPAAYMIQDEEKTVEEVRLPKGVSMIGSVTFNPQGLPNAPASFIVSKGIRIAHVEVDRDGRIQFP